MYDLVTNFPIRPNKSTNLGSLYSIILNNVFAKMFDCEHKDIINVLHSYKDIKPNVSVIRADLDNLGFNNRLYKDDEHIEDLKNLILRLTEERIIYEKEETMLQCDCGRIDMKIDAKNNNIKLFDEEDNCKFCHGIPHEKTKKVLVMKLDERYLSGINVYPSFLLKEINMLIERFKNKEIVISKSRTTGIEINVNGVNYNIDIDLLASMLPQFNNSEKELITVCNRHLYNVMICNFINNVLGDKEIDFLLYPFINGINNFQSEILDKETDKILLIMLNSLKWRNKDATFDERLIEFYSSIHPKKAKGLLLSLIRIQEALELETLEDVLYKGFGNAEMIKNMKKLKEINNNECVK